MVEPSAAPHRVVPGGHGGLTVNRNAGAGAGKNIIRIRAEHGVQVSLNPLVVPAVTFLLQDMVANVSQMFPLSSNVISSHFSVQVLSSISTL